MLKKALSLALAALLFLSILPAATAEPLLPEAVSAEMLSADFWCENLGNSIVMDRQQIAAFNTAGRNMIELNGQSYALNDIQPLTDGAFVRDFIESISLPKNCEQLFVNGVRRPQPYWDGLAAARAMEAIPEVVSVRYGYSVTREELRAFPTADFAGVSADEKLYDKLVMSELLPYMPLAVLHESADGEWYFVLLYGYGGWVKKEAVALCLSREDWAARMEPADFLVVTGREIRLSEEPYCPALSGLTLPMGTRLPLAAEAEAPELLHYRRGYGCHTVKLPVRGEEGYIRDEYAFVPAAEDVHRGYVDFTVENELRLAFKFLGDRYGWAGMFSANDCSGLIHQVFSCFGFVLPRTAGAMMSMPALTAVDISGYSGADKLGGLAAVAPGSLLGFPGHIMIYLGNFEGRAYVLSSAGSFGPAQPPAGYDYSANTVCITSLAHTTRRNGISWLDSINSLLTFS